MGSYNAPATARAVAPASVQAVLRSAGSPLAPVTARVMGARMGQDFSGIRVHADAQAARSASDIAAQAWAAGPHLAFAEGAYAPDTAAGEVLLAHELAHAVQQRGAALPPAPALRSPDDPAEQQAADAAAALAAGRAPQSLTSAPPGIYRVGDRAKATPPATIPAGRRAIIQWGDDPATVANVRALQTGARSGPNAAGSDLVLTARELQPGSLAEVREVTVVIHGDTDVDAKGHRVIAPGGDQPAATHGTPGLPQRAEGPVEAISPEAMAGKLAAAGFGSGRWTTYRIRLAMCYAGVGGAESFSARLGRAAAALGISNETLGYRGAVTATGGVGTGYLPPTEASGSGPPRAGQPPPKPAEAGKPVAANYYPALRGTQFGPPGTRVRRDVTPGDKPVGEPAAPRSPPKVQAAPPPASHVELPRASVPGGRLPAKMGTAPAPELHDGPSHGAPVTKPAAPTRPAVVTPDSLHHPEGHVPSGRGRAAGAIGTAMAAEALFIIVEFFVQRWIREHYAKDLADHAQQKIHDQLLAEKGRLDSAVKSRQSDVEAWLAEGRHAWLAVELELDWQNTDIGSILMRVSITRIAVVKEGEAGLKPQPPDMSWRGWARAMLDQAVDRSVDHQIVQIPIEGG